MSNEVLKSLYYGQDDYSHNNAQRESVAFGHNEGSSKFVLHQPKILQFIFEDVEVKYEGKMDEDHLYPGLLQFHPALHFMFKVGTRTPFKKASLLEKS